MKKPMMAWALMVALLLCSCTQTGPSAETAEPAPVEELTAETVARTILNSQGDGEDYALLSDEDIEFYVNQIYGMDGGEVAEAVVYTVGGADPREVAVVRPAEGVGTARTAQGLESYRKSRVGDFFGYAPQAAALVERGLVVSTEEYSTLMICTDPDEAKEAMITFFELALRPSPEPTPEPMPTLSPVATSTAEPENIFTIRDPDAVVPFDPPREFDMSLYDDTPIVKAWETGDESGLSEKQTAILAKCREIFAQVITGGMTDFEKELALHDWLTTHGEYDHTHYDPRTPLGREDNTNPYGMLVKGYGICLGYAETFRLLMDLCGVECITVPGAAFHSSEDHAWNMVKLEGEWYCVDPTWDNSPSHHYFNVTSEYLRQTDHQWDYENTPEATATRFHWEGYGPLPT